MLKGFVSGEEKDIVRIPMKGKNLFDRDSISYPTGTTIKYFPIEVPDGTYTLSTNFPDFDTKDIFFLAGNASSGASSSGNGVSLSTTRTRTAENGYVTVAMRYNEVRANPADYDIMLNLGSAPLPYEPYGYQEGWEVRDSQDRLIWGREDELQTATGTLPFKGYTLPVKVKSLLGNAVQNGTPSPQNIVTPEMCGVLNENLAIIDSNSRTITNYYYYDVRLTDVIPAGTYTLSFSVDSKTGTPYSGSIGRGTTSGYTADVVYVNIGSDIPVIIKTKFTLTNSACVWARFLRASSPSTFSYSISKIRVEEGSTAYGWKVPFENHGENLWGVPIVQGGVVDVGDLVDLSTRVRGEYIPVQPETQYTIRCNKAIRTIYAYLNKGKVGAVYGGSTQDTTITFTTPANCDSVCVGFMNNPNTAIITPSDIEFVMLSLGSTPKPYSPYLNATIPVYLGEVPTVRRVRKLVLDGTEDTWGQTEAINSGFYFDMTGYLRQRGVIIVICSHYVSQDNINVAAEMQDGKISFYANATQPSSRFYIKDSNFVNLADFKSYLSAQYAAGTPVVVWYVLAEPETTISNEPLCKISTYADELTTIQVHGLSAPLYGIGSYKDTLNLSTGVVTRKVKKLVLTGNEQNWTYEDTYERFGIGVSDMYVLDTRLSTVMCTQYPCIDDGRPIGEVPNNSVYVGKSTPNKLFIKTDSYTTINAWKNYLQEQYSNGTPVVIWYILSTPTTETVTVPTGMTGEIEGYLTQVSTPSPTNRSVPKWNGVEETGGTYAVTVYTPPEIPTTTGQNTLIVDSNLAPSKLEVSVHAKKIHYGFKIDKSNDDSESAVIYTHDAVTMTPAHMDFTNDRFDYGSWGNAFFVRDCYPVALNLDGTIAYRLDPDDYTKKTDGTPSDIFYELLTAAPSDWSTQWKQYYTKDANDNYELNSQGSAPTFTQDTYYKLTYNSSFTGNFMMAFPKVWFYRHEDSQYNYIEISNYKLSDDWKCYAHINASGQEVDFIYLPLFKGVIKDSKLRSLPGQIPQGATTATDEVNAATALGSRWQIWDHSSVECINDLLTLMSKSIDSQGRYGKGRESGYNSSDTVTYGKLQTGTLIKGGKFHGFSSSYKEVKVFGIEGFWANGWDRLQGMLLVNNVWKIKMTPPYNFTGTDFVTLSNASVLTGNGYLSKVQTSEYGSIPASIDGGSSTKYFKDYFYKTATDTRVALRGGYCNHGARCGFRYVNVNNAASYSDWNIGASPVYK